MTDTIKVVYNSTNEVLIMLGDAGVNLSRAEAEQLFVDLGHALQDMDALPTNKE